MDNTPKKAMVIAAHPDDAEFGCSGTVAKWTREGAEVIYVICTNGDKGSADPEMTSAHLAAIRREEQICAAKVLGVKDVIFLGHPDGGLEDTPEFRGELVREIRRFRPDIVLSTDPYRRYGWHRDHRIAATVTLDALYPYCRDHLFYTEHKAEGLKPHKVKLAYLWGAEEPNLSIDITDTFDVKLTALLCHQSQLGQYSKEQLGGFLKEMSVRMKRKGGPMSEAFYRVEFRP